jgi:hypothetical protein
MKTIIDLLLSKLRESSTWTGLATLLALAGIVIDPNQLAAVGSLVIALIGLYDVFRKEKK